MNLEVAGPVLSGPMKTSSVALGLTALVFAGLAWTAIASIKRAEEVNRRNRRIDDLRGTIGRLDEVLTMSARMGAVTGDAQWETRYRGFEPQLAGAIQEALSLASDTGAADAVAHTDAANTALVAMEKRAFDLIRQGHLEAARAILFSEAYDGQKWVYSAGMDRLDKTLAASVQRAVEGQSRSVRMVLIVFAAGMSLLVLSWFVALRTVTRGNAALVRSHERLSWQSAELAQLNAELDGRVAERTRRLLETAEEYRLLFDSNPHPMWVFDVETLAFLAVNDAAVRLYGYSRDEFLGMTIKEIRPIEEVPALLEHLATIPDSPSLLARQVKHRRKDGSLLEVAGASNPIEFHGKRARLFMANDVTEKKALEAQLLQAQKMEAVGRLAGGVAHDFNNSLGVILGYTELLMRQAGEAQRGKLEQILKATQRASGLTHQLLAFSRKQIVDPKVLDLNALLSELEKMLGRLIGEDVDLAIVPGADLGQVKADPGQLEQVVMNLCVNARDAMPDGGLLRIETANAELDAGYAARHAPLAPGRYVMLAVSDAGCGIEKEMLSKIFEPFFTTKERGKGTGLGLAMVYGIVKQAGGYVWVYSEVGRGTTFKIYLPRIDEPGVARAVQETPMPSKGWETILLVEDEGSLRALAREILEDHGYRVIEAAGPNEAIEIAHRHPEPIHLLVTDVVMPVMNGRALAELLVAARPGLRVLYMSGYTDDVIAHSGVLESGTLLIEKPFTTLAFLGRVRAALGERGTDRGPQFT